MNTNKSDDDLDTPIWGAAAIAEELRLDRHQAYYALGQGHIPATKIGRQYVSTKRRLRACINGQQLNQQ
jgi:hypothetical protein